jgi:hypothetical protein
MKVTERTPPRTFTVGRHADIEISHVADVALEPDEQLTLTTGSGTEFDVVRKSWGYYATPSLNGRLTGHGLRPVLIRNADGRLYLLLVERGHEADFDAYVERDALQVVAWLDSDEAADRAARALAER